VISLSGIIAILVASATAAVQTAIATPIYVQLAEAAVSGAAGAIVKEVAKRKRQQQKTKKRS